MWIKMKKIRDGEENSIEEDARSLALKIRRHIKETKGCDEDNNERANKSACFDLLYQLIKYGKS